MRKYYLLIDAPFASTRTSVELAVVVGVTNGGTETAEVVDELVGGGSAAEDVDDAMSAAMRSIFLSAVATSRFASTNLFVTS